MTRSMRHLNCHKRAQDNRCEINHGGIFVAKGNPVRKYGDEFCLPFTLRSFVIPKETTDVSPWRFLTVSLSDLIWKRTRIDLHKN